MKVKKHKNLLPKIFYESLKKRGIKEFRPPQKQALDAGVLNDTNIVLSSPTGSGKTMSAEMAFIKHFTQEGKTIYIVPLKSLASEKYESFKERYDDYGVKTAISVGKLDSQDPYLEDYDIIISTSEKVDSLIRHKAGFLKKISCVIIDEIHLMNDTNRGPTLEILITRLREMLPKAQIIALSATISNDMEIADWLDANLVKSDYRPVELRTGTLLHNKIHLENEEYKVEEKSSPEKTILHDTLQKDKQVIYFLGSRRNAEALARRLSKMTKDFLKKDEKKRLKKLSNDVRKVLEKPTKQCIKLSKYMKKGCAFHHAGLVHEQRKIIEQAFRQRLIKTICATPTLAAGINLPAFRVVVRDLTRFSPKQGRYYLPVLEVFQMFGRAGRPGLEEYGEGLTIAKTSNDMEEIFEKYINGSVEEVYSKLSVEPVLRTHVLALICDRFCNSRDSMYSFFGKTFFAHQYENMDRLYDLLDKIISLLIELEFIEQSNNKFHATRIGMRINELYLEPLAADILIRTIELTKKKKPSTLGLLHSICFTKEVGRLLRIKKNNMVEYHKIMDSSKLILKEPNPFSYDYEDYLKSIKTAKMFYDWINEEDYTKLSEKYNVSPGDVHYLLYNADWLLYSMSELARLKDRKDLIGVLHALRTRVKHGVSKELLPLVSIKGIGRVRARRLYKKGIKNVKNIKNSPEKVKKILGPVLGEKIVNRAQQ